MAEWTTPSAVHSKCGESVGYAAVKSIDENLGTFWYHGIVCFHWIIYDMGESKTITKVRLYQDSNSLYRWGRAVGLYVYVSDDPENFGDAVWGGVLDAVGWQESGVFSKSGRYVKLLSQSSSSGQRLYEFDAYAETGAPPEAKKIMVDGFVSFVS